MSNIVHETGYWITIRKNTVTDPNISIDDFATIFSSAERMRYGLRDTNHEDFLGRLAGLPNFYRYISPLQALSTIAQSPCLDTFGAGNIKDAILSCERLHDNDARGFSQSMIRDFKVALKILAVTKKQFETSAIYQKLLGDEIISRIQMRGIVDGLKGQDD